MTDQPDSFAAALAAFQAELPKVSKSSQGNRGRYADLADVSSKVLPLLAKHGLSWSAAPTVTDEGLFVLRYALRHVSGGERVGGDYPLPAANEPPQTLGSAITYAKRYALCAVTGVAPDNDDDDGAHATENHRAAPPAQRKESTSAAKKPAPKMKSPEQMASDFVTALLAVATNERADAAVAAAAKSPVCEMEVSGLVTAEHREALDIKDGENVSLNDLALLVSEYVAKHGKAVKDATEAAPA